jgi:hypothetical protein
MTATIIALGLVFAAGWLTIVGLRGTRAIAAKVPRIEGAS